MASNKRKPKNVLSDESKEILRNYIINPELPINDPLPEILPKVTHEEYLYHVPLCPASTNLFPERDIFTGEIVNFVEQPIIEAGADANNSMSFRRAPGPLEESVRGSTMNFPFWPGGFEEPAKDIEKLNFGEFEFGTELLTIPPGFAGGLEFEGYQKDMNCMLSDDNDLKTVDLLSSLEKEGNEINEWLKMEQEVESQKQKEIADMEEVNNVFDNIIITEQTAGTMKISKPTQWVEVIDTSVPVTDFDTKIPEPAKEYPFELDVFQKQAIIKLEERQHVFVAAHTSAGKTVVAEYAIALSQKHMTKAIYTSPVKALSNQKYQDFRKIFKDVGLITGDLQLNPTASCLIMTTEILRSMLYCGSDNTRDLEYVILDEVHYINDDDRGHVWEEVLILLPDHVQIIMLSATVPNPVEFANWVGSTKKKKVFVISTSKRPVPLVHYLYTGNNRKTQNDIFMLVNETGEFSMENYTKVKRKLEELQNDKKAYSFNDEERRWKHLICYLKENDKLPVVAFTLSRNRCDKYAEMVQGIELNNGLERSEVRTYFHKCIQNLKPADRVIPQVLSMQKSLEKGIGIHHSGILPILKEIVEMSFQRGWVKILFATETFAMGVNMPTRTVVFDSHIKFDGVEKRMLQPAEYTQMAGRAGRRGMDKNGTVILLCKRLFPRDNELRSIILGKPNMLRSRFRLTYAMILNLLRVDKFLSIEEIMSHSFKEFEVKKQIPENQKNLELTRKEFSKLQELSEYLQPLCDFYDIAKEYFSYVDVAMKALVAWNNVAKELKTGKVLIINHENHYNKLAVLLVSRQQGKHLYFWVLVLDNQFPAEKEKSKDPKQSEIDRGDLWHKMLSFAYHNKFFTPHGEQYTVLKITPCDILEVTKTTVKVDGTGVLKHWEQKQIPRFKDSPDQPFVLKVVKDLYDLTIGYNNQQIRFQFINFSQEISLMDDRTGEAVKQMLSLRKRLRKAAQHTKIANFEHEFALVYDRRSLENKLKDLEFKISKRNLSLYPEYCDKLKVLEELKYIDAHHEIMMKGRVACEMGQNELIITELVLCNMFNDLDSAEIAALLSSLVFQGKTDKKPTLPERLKKCIDEIVNIDELISRTERKYGVEYMDTNARLNFNLVQVVYEWARNKPFVEILKLTDFQPGIIVRCIQQLAEILLDVRNAAQRIGNPTLQSKMEDVSNAIKRDIVFAASLYTSDEI